MKANEGGNKYPLILGGFIGFLVAIIGGWFVGNDMGIIIRNASLGAVVGLISVKGFLFMLEFCIKSSQNSIKRDDPDKSNSEFNDT